MIQVDMKLVLVLFCLLGSQAIAAQAPALSVRNGDRTVTLTAEALSALPIHAVEVANDQGPVRYEGVRLRSVLMQAGVGFGEALRGARLASYVVATAADGYRVVFALAELDDAFTNREVLIVLKANGQPLSAQEGPFRLLVPDDKARARWMRNLTSLTVQTAGTP